MFLLVYRSVFGASCTDCCSALQHLGEILLHSPIVLLCLVPIELFLGQFSPGFPGNEISRLGDDCAGWRLISEQGLCMHLQGFGDSSRGLSGSRAGLWSSTQAWKERMLPQGVPFLEYLCAIKCQILFHTYKFWQ